MIDSQRLRHLADIAISNVDKKSTNDNGEQPVALCNYTDVYYNARITDALEFMAATATIDQVRRFSLRSGDILLTKDSETADDIAVSALVPNDLPGVVCGYHLALVRTNQSRVDPSYLFWALRSDTVRRQFTVAATGVTRFGLRSEAIGDVTVPIRPWAEQRVIADYLDTETARIDALITKKRQLIQLIEERWHSETIHWVLRGLDPITGEGGVHDGWKVIHLGVLLALHRGFDLPADTRLDGSVPVISSGGISGSHSEKACDGPGVVTGRYGTIGEVFFVEGPYWPLNTTLFVSEFRGNDAKWAYYLLSAIPLDIDSAKSAVTGINRNVIGTLWAPRPPLECQSHIAEHLDASHRNVDRLLNLVRCQIELLIERRQALITAAVTGELEIPVSEAVA